MSINPTSTAYQPISVKVSKVDIDSGYEYKLTLATGNFPTIKKTVTVTVAEIIEWCDEQGYTFGMSEEVDMVCTEESKGGWYSRGECVYGFIRDSLNDADWLAFASTLPVWDKMPRLAIKSQPALSARYDRQERYGGFQRPQTSSTYPSWFTYDTHGKWIMVNGVKTHVNPDHLGQHLLGSEWLEGCDEGGYFMKGYGRHTKIYVNPRSLTIGDHGWWKYAQTLTKELA